MVAGSLFTMVQEELQKDDPEGLKLVLEQVAAA